ncbi:MAG: methytransferase partner Trm112 [Dehalococcoidia bacterium]
MKKDLMDILACPNCKKPLELTVEEQKEDEIIAGNLHCQGCGEDYPIKNAIPHLLPKELRQ